MTPDAVGGLYVHWIVTGIAPGSRRRRMVRLCCSVRILVVGRRLITCRRRAQDHYRFTSYRAPAARATESKRHRRAGRQRTGPAVGIRRRRGIPGGGVVEVQLESTVAHAFHRFALAILGLALPVALVAYGGNGDSRKSGAAGASLTALGPESMPGSLAMY